MAGRACAGRPARAVAGRAEVMTVSARTGDGVEAFRARLSPGETVAFTGSSGVGKSSLLNVLLGGREGFVSALSIPIGPGLRGLLVRRANGRLHGADVTTPDAWGAVRRRASARRCR